MIRAHSDEDIKSLTVHDPKLLDSAQAAFKKYNEEQLTTVKLPGSHQNVRRHSCSHCDAHMELMAVKVLISSYNSLDGDRYYDVESQSDFAFDHATQVRGL